VRRGEMIPGFFGGIGIQELLIILVIVLIVFGASRLPQVGRSLGRGIREFKKGIKGEDEKGNGGEKTEG
jgi:sec-independent protein translocase protein TatA